MVPYDTRPITPNIRNPTTGLHKFQTREETHMLRVLILAAFALCVGLTSLTAASHAQTKGAKMILDPAVHGLKRLKPLQLGVDGDSS